MSSDGQPNLDLKSVAMTTLKAHASYSHGTGGSQRRMSSSLISHKTKAALAPLKGKGILGNRTNLAEAQRKGTLVQTVRADKFAAAILPKIRAVLAWVTISRRTKTLEEIAAALTKGDVETLRGRQREQNLSHIAHELNAAGVKTARGRSWSSATVKRVILRAHELGLLDST